jgi:hypothetical protein
MLYYLPVCLRSIGRLMRRLVAGYGNVFVYSVLRCSGGAEYFFQYGSIRDLLVGTLIGFIGCRVSVIYTVFKFDISAR